MLASFVELVVTVPLLVLEHGLVGMAIGHAVGQLVAFGIGLAWVRREDPLIRISPVHATRSGLRAVLQIGGPMQALAFVQVAIGEGVKVLLSVLVDPRATALYGLADKLVQLARTPTTAAVGPLLAVFADLQAAGERTRERDAMHRAAKVVAIVGGGVAIFVAVTARPALLAWTGQDVPLAAWAVQLLVVANLFPQQSAVLTANLRARGIVRIEAGFAAVSTIVGLALLGLLAIVEPFTAVVWARAVSTAIAGAWFLRASLRHIGESLVQWWHAAALLRVTAVLLGAGALLLGARALVDLPDLPLSARWNAVLDVLAWAIFYGALLGAGVWRWALDVQERALVLRVILRR
jgi:O-antigen/teichoic acid export membrane protein